MFIKSKSYPEMKIAKIMSRCYKQIMVDWTKNDYDDYLHETLNEHNNHFELPNIRPFLESIKP